MGDEGEYWNDHKQHKRDVSMGIVRCNDCAEITEDARRPGFQFCKKCKKVFRSPRWKLEPKKDTSAGGWDNYECWVD